MIEMSAPVPTKTETTRPATLELTFFDFHI